MNNIIKIIIASLIVNYSYTTWAGEETEKLNESMKGLSLVRETESAARPEPVINLAIEEYIKENFDQRRLLLPCGHKPIQDPYYSTDINGSHEIHEHKGWYTLDIEAEVVPDYVADLNLPTTLDYLFQNDTWDIIYLEKISFSHLTTHFFTKARQSLREGGVLVFSPWWIEKFTRAVVVDDKRNSSTITLYIDTFYPSAAYYLAKESSPELYSYTSDPELEATVTDLTLLEQKLKTTFMDKFGFSDVSLYTDTILDDKWMTGVTNKINTQYKEELNSATEAYKSASPDKQQELMSSMITRINEIIVQEREKVLTTSWVYKGDTASPGDTTPLGYINYPFILDSYGLEFRRMRKGNLFAIAKK
ncbi:hypothetical protein [Candidatus Odyssella thessalonicensis]|uniref:hypothetical protein n=1 Tax=Candidatus Odyssella thessalonicensis TaxID=84647 RepID=UPI000225B91E|nr:hypothetical protein [Candidatus Odyssella thessalonicensis]